MPVLLLSADGESPRGTPMPESSPRPSSDWSKSPRLYTMKDETGDDAAQLPGMPSTLDDKPTTPEFKISVAKPRRASQVESNARLFGWADPEEIKKKVLATSLVTEPPYDVFHFYWDTGLFQWLAKHWVFENVTLTVICLNAIYMALDTDLNKPEMMKSGESNTLLQSPIAFQVLEHAFCTYFTVEWLIRFAAFRDKRNCFCDGWFFFDTILVMMMVGETWVFTAVALSLGSSARSPIGNAAMLRLLRLLRLARLVRMLRSLPQLMMLVKGMLAAMASVFYVMCLLLIVTYVFAIGFTQLTAGHELGAKYFANVSVAMYNLMIYATFGDNLADFTNDLRSQMWPLLVFCLIYMSLAQLTLMNMLVGVLCDVVSSVAVREREERSMSQMIADMKLIFASLDKDFDNEVSYKEFSAMIEMPEALSVLRRQQVNPLQVLDLADLFFFEDGEPIQLRFEDFIDVIMSLRESNEAKVKDIWHLWVQYRNARRKDVMEQEAKLQEMNKKIERVSTQLSSKIDQTSAKLEEKLVGLLGELRQVPQPRSSTPTPLSTTSVAGRHASKTVKAEAGSVRKVTSTVSRLVSKRSDAETKERQ
eukprot:TRINITY_DN72512_c0_g1_i1.p1 TRINITY_DN72512_c0_g1~~TRINITY_DN72512_c0_g1_i1.p1  ORF type:complete len:591 (+),score=119.86 TRINITY_DN72512_c0_g1_i1:126-1898(+)